MRTLEQSLLDLLIEGEKNRLRESPGSEAQSMLPTLQTGILTDVDISMTVTGADGKRYVISYNRDGNLGIRMIHYPGVRLQTEPDGKWEQANKRFLEAYAAQGRQDVEGKLFKAILGMLSDMKFSLKASGTTYLVEALIMMMSFKDETYRIGLTKEIYPPIARRHKVSVVSIERNIRKAIETAWSKMSCDYAMMHYPYDYTSRLGRPTNQEFLFALAGMIRRNYPEYVQWCRENKALD